MCSYVKPINESTLSCTMFEKLKTGQDILRYTFAFGWIGCGAASYVAS
jgi:hypothetical protein